MIIFHDAMVRPKPYDWLNRFGTMRYFAIVISTLLVSGCLGDDRSDAGALDLPPEVAPEVFRFTEEDLFQVNGALVMILASDLIVNFTVHENATALLAEVQWRCATEPCPMDLSVRPEEGTWAEGARGEGEARMAVEAPAADSWYASLRASTLSVHAGGDAEFRISVFYDGPIPDGYTAFA